MPDSREARERVEHLQDRLKAVRQELELPASPEFTERRPVLTQLVATARRACAAAEETHDVAKRGLEVVERRRSLLAIDVQARSANESPVIAMVASPLLVLCGFASMVWLVVTPHPPALPYVIGVGSAFLLGLVWRARLHQRARP